MDAFRWGNSLDDLLIQEDESLADDNPPPPNASVVAPLCATPDAFPTIEEFILGVKGNGAMILYACSSAATFILMIQFFIMLKKILESVPNSRVKQTIWIHSVYLAVSLMTLLSIIMPKSSVLTWAIYRIYCGIAINKFVNLIMTWNNGDSAVIAHSDGKTINLRKPPCCFCLCCPIKAEMNKAKLKLIRWSVHQMPFSQSILLFLTISLDLAGYIRYDDMSFDGGNLYLEVLIMVSFFTAMWGLFILFHITERYSLLREKNFTIKAALLKVLLVLVNVQTFIIDILTFTGVIGCNIHMSRVANGAVVKDVMTLIESFALGSLCFVFTFNDSFLETSEKETAI